MPARTRKTAAPATNDAGVSPMPVPPLLKDVAAWAWRLLVLGLLLYYLLRFVDVMYLILLPLFASLFAVSLAYPLVRFFGNHGLSRWLSTLITVVLAVLVLGGISVFVIDRATVEYPDLVDQTSQAVTHFRHFLTVDLHVKSSSTSSVGTTITNYLDKHSSSVAAGALTGITTVAEVIAAAVLWFFITVFLLYDGENIWAWIVHLFPERARPRVEGAGIVAWDRLAGFVRGTFIIALVHAVVAAVALTILGVPLVAPLTLLIFVGSFVPIIGSILFGGLAVAITFVTQGTVSGIVLIVILLIDNQIEAHVMQPFLVGRYVRLHPLAVALSIAGGAILQGIAGAVLAVPFVAVVYAVLHYLATGTDPVATDDESPTGDGEFPTGKGRMVPETD